MLGAVEHNNIGVVRLSSLQLIELSDHSRKPHCYVVITLAGFPSSFMKAAPDAPKQVADLGMPARQAVTYGCAVELIDRLRDQQNPSRAENSDHIPYGAFGIGKMHEQSLACNEVERACRKREIVRLASNCAKAMLREDVLKYDSDDLTQCSSKSRPVISIPGGKQP